LDFIKYKELVDQKDGNAFASLIEWGIYSLTDQKKKIISLNE
jgi:hypothetical protein